MWWLSIILELRKQMWHSWSKVDTQNNAIRELWVLQKALLISKVEMVGEDSQRQH